MDGDERKGGAQAGAVLDRSLKKNLTSKWVGGLLSWDQDGNEKAFWVDRESKRNASRPVSKRSRQRKEASSERAKVPTLLQFAEVGRFREEENRRRQ